MVDLSMDMDIVFAVPIGAHKVLRHVYVMDPSRQKRCQL
jgi:hypothetical protein